MQYESSGCLFPLHVGVFLSSVISVFNNVKDQVYCSLSDNFLQVSFTFLYSFLRIKSKTRTKKLYRKVALDVVGLFNANNIKMQRKYSVVKHRPISKLLVLLKFTFLAFCVAGPGVESA